MNKQEILEIQAERGKDTLFYYKRYSSSHTDSQPCRVLGQTEVTVGYGRYAKKQKQYIIRVWSSWSYKEGYQRLLYRPDTIMVSARYLHECGHRTLKDWITSKREQDKRTAQHKQEHQEQASRLQNLSKQLGFTGYGLSYDNKFLEQVFTDALAYREMTKQEEVA